MEYMLTFLEGIITFISPCLLPMIPIYVSYFAAGEQEGKRQRSLVHSLAFVLGFTVVFVFMGAFAGSLGTLLKQYQTVFNIVGGSLIILFGFSFLGTIRIPFLSSSRGNQRDVQSLNSVSAFIFGVIFSIGWTPCVGAFLGSALMLAAGSGEVLRGIFMLLSFSIGLGIPFVASAVLIEKLNGAFDFIKRNYNIINLLSGGFLILVGISMACGLWGRILAFFL